jgi:hypothetical protein
MDESFKKVFSNLFEIAIQGYGFRSQLSKILIGGLDEYEDSQGIASG